MTASEKAKIVMQIEQARSDMHRQVDERMDALVAALCRRQCRSAAERRKLKRLALRVPPEMLEVRSRRQKRARCA